ncbi:MAG: ribonuclease III [Calditrichaeota bacterium]|nr:MAG: ribonuclease III [Calditrichota bacterium]
MPRMLSTFFRRIRGKRKEYPIDINRLQEKIGYVFSNPDRLVKAVSHRSSFSQSAAQVLHSNERLEFLGDAVLGLIVTRYLYDRFPEENEGILSRKKAVLVSRKVLGVISQQLELGEFLILNKGEEKTGGRKKMSNLANLFEAVLGAIYLDGGFEAAEAFVKKYLLKQAGRFLTEERFFNYKSQLLEFSQARGWGIPRYQTIAESGPDHNKTFRVEVVVYENYRGEGEGPNKKNAEQKAARDVVEKLSVDYPELKGKVS